MIQFPYNTICWPYFSLILLTLNPSFNSFLYVRSSFQFLSSKSQKIYEQKIYSIQLNVCLSQRILKKGVSRFYPCFSFSDICFPFDRWFKFNVYRDKLKNLISFSLLVTNPKERLIKRTSNTLYLWGNILIIWWW